MGQYTSYYLYQKFEKIGNQDYIPVYPNVYSIDADGTMPTVVKEQNDVNCGYIPPVDPIYRWADSGTTCVGLDKYQMAIKQVSNDGGLTWTNVSPAEYSATTLIEGDSPDCIPKLVANYSDSSRYIVVCNSSSALTQEEVRDYSTPYSSMTSAVIGDCVVEIGVNAFQDCSGLTSVNIPDNINYIDWFAFSDCSSLTSVTIGSGVIRIHDYAFYGCSSLTGLTIYATTPPEMTDLMDGHQFDNTNNCPIYVPAASVNAYKAAAGWSAYANRIQAIP